MQNARKALRLTGPLLAIGLAFGAAQSAAAATHQALPYPPPPQPGYTAPVGHQALPTGEATHPMPARALSSGAILTPLKPADASSTAFYQKIYKTGMVDPQSSKSAAAAIAGNKVSFIVVNGLDGDQHKVALVYPDNESRVATIDTSALELAYARGMPIITIPQDGGVDIWAYALVAARIAAVVTQIMISLLMLGAGLYFGRRYLMPASTRIKPEDDYGSFDDLVGMESAKRDIREVVDFLKNPERYGRNGGHVPRGVLLVGPPGVGKTALARAAASEARVPFYSVNASEIPSSFIAQAAGKVRKIFSQVRSTGGILYMDEIDVIAQDPNGLSTDLGMERDQILKQILVELDGLSTGGKSRAGARRKSRNWFTKILKKINRRIYGGRIFKARLFRPKSRPFVLLASTNHMDRIHPAVLRPGRFDRIVRIPQMDSAGREAAFRLHARDVRLNPGVDFHQLAQETPGATGAEIANLVNEAAIESVRRNRDDVDQSCFETAIERVSAGSPRPDLVISEEQQDIVAAHEAGHALAAYLIPDADRPIRATVVPHGGSLGHVTMAPPEDEFIISRKRIIARIKVALAGRAAELDLYGNDAITTGAEGDWQAALGMLRNMIGRFGMGNSARHIGPAPQGGGLMSGPVHSERSMAEFDAALAAELHAVETYLVVFMKENREKLLRLKAALLRERTLNRTRIARIIEGDETEDAAPRRAAEHRPPAVTGLLIAASQTGNGMDKAQPPSGPNGENRA